MPAGNPPCSTDSSRAFPVRDRHCIYNQAVPTTVVGLSHSIRCWSIAVKKLVIAILIFVVMLAAVAGGVILTLDSAAKTAVEKGGTFAMGVNTTLTKADVKPFAGQFEMNGLTVANPEGYQTKHFMTLGKGDVALSIGSIMQDTIRLPHLKLSDIDLNMEKKDGKANYQQIIDNLKKLSSDKPADPNAKKFVIELVEISNVKVHADVMGKMVDVPIEMITLKNVGAGGAGVDIGQLLGVITKSVFAAVVQAGGGLIPADMMGDLTKGLGDLANLDKLGEIANVKAVGELAGKAGEAAKQAAEEAGKAADDLANKAKEGLGGVLGGGDKDKKDENPK